MSDSPYTDFVSHIIAKAKQYMTDEAYIAYLRDLKTLTEEEGTEPDTRNRTGV